MSSVDPIMWPDFWQGMFAGVLATIGIVVALGNAHVKRRPRTPEVTEECRRARHVRLLGPEAPPPVDWKREGWA